MNISKLLKTVLLIALVLLPLDYLYLSSFSGYFSKVFKNIQGQKLELYIPGAILCYIIIILSIYYFGFIKNMTYSELFLLGFVIYGIYETTNYATFKNWPVFMIFLDTFWGGILYMTTFYIVNLLLKIQ